MKLIKKISALLVAVMAFSFVGTALSQKTVQAASTMSVHSQTGYVPSTHGSQDYYYVGYASSLEVSVSGLTVGQTYEIECFHTTDVGRGSTSPRVDCLIRDVLTFRANYSTQKIKLDFDQIKPEYFEGTNLIEGFYNVSVNGVYQYIYVTGDYNDGTFDETYLGVLDIEQGTPYQMAHPYGYYDMKKIGVTNAIDFNLTDKGAAITGDYTYAIEYCDTEVHPLRYGFDLTISQGSGATSGTYRPSGRYADADGNFRVGVYKITYYDGISSSATIIAENMIFVTGDRNDGVYPELRCFVTRCYTECLGRPYDAAGHDYWENCLAGAFNGCDVAKEFFFSDEFTSLGLSNEEYVRRLYRTFMDRDAEPAGFAFWTNCLRNGASRLDIFYGFINSPEWSNICAEYGSCINPSIRSGGYVMPQGVSISASNQTIAFVARLYSEGLGRNPEGAGLKMWAEALDQRTTTGRAVAREFFLGTEFTNLGVSNQEFLIRAYRIFMDRPIDVNNDPGFLYWLGQLNSGRVSRADIVDTFAASNEFAVVCSNAGFNA